MLGETKPVKRVLFVDDSASFLDMVEKVFGVWSKGNWQFLKALDATRALAILNDQVVHLVVIDLRMPGMDGLEFLRLVHKRFPDMPKAILTGAPTEDSREEGLSCGAVLYLEKPGSIEEMEKIYRTLDELAEAQPEGGFRGMLWHVGLTEVVQIECLNRNSSILEITAGKLRGQVYIKNGEILHAEAWNHKGREALSVLLALRGGEFNLKPFAAPSETTISGSWEGLLMEAAQATDEDNTRFIKAARQVADAAEGESDTVIEKRLFNPDILAKLLDTLQRNTLEIGKAFGGFEYMDTANDKVAVAATLNAEGRVVLQLDHPGRDNHARHA